MNVHIITNLESIVEALTIQKFATSCEKINAISHCIRRSSILQASSQSHGFINLHSHIFKHNK